MTTRCAVGQGSDFAHIKLHIGSYSRTANKAPTQGRQPAGAGAATTATKSLSPCPRSPHILPNPSPILARNRNRGPLLNQLSAAEDTLRVARLSDSQRRRHQKAAMKTVLTPALAIGSESPPSRIGVNSTKISHLLCPRRTWRAYDLGIPLVSCELRLCF